jgi:hypothetical protein
MQFENTRWLANCRNTSIKKTFTKWEQYQDKPIPEDQHNSWKVQGQFKDVLTGYSGKSLAQTGQD